MSAEQTLVVDVEGLLWRMSVEVARQGDLEAIATLLPLLSQTPASVTSTSSRVSSSGVLR